MSNYVKIVDYAAKDALAPGNAGKLVKGVEIGAEFDAVATAVATKANEAGPTFTGVVTVAGQVAFPATQNASAGANVLDDYEEGTWVPVVSSSAGTITAYTATGKYTKIGNRVLCDMSVTITTKGTAASTMVVTLPFLGSGVGAGCGTEIQNSGKGLSGDTTGTDSRWFLEGGVSPFVANGDKFTLSFSYSV